MVNRYITALLVVLAATGMEAQTYQQALRFALNDISTMSSFSNLKPKRSKKTF